MPAPAAAPPPSAPARPAQSAPAPAPAPAKAPATQPKAAPTPAPKPAKATAPPSPAEPAKSAVQEEIDPFQEAFSGLKKLANVEADDLLGEQSPKPDEQPKPDEKPEEQAQEQDEEIEGQEQKSAPDPKLTEKRPSPWKLVEHYKSTNQNLQQEIAQLRSKISGETPKDVSDKLSAIEKRNQELEEHIRFLDYEKSQEFTEKYRQPYEDAWTRAVSSLKGLKIPYNNPNTGEVEHHDLTPQHIAALANMDPAAARVEIKRIFPEDHAEVRGYIDRIRDLSQVQQRALEEQKAKGGEWQKQQEAQNKAIIETNAKLWKQFSEESIEKLEFLRPIEGDDERNVKLEKAAAFVAEALSGRANDPKLSEEERAMVIKKHVALRNRAIAYSVLMHENKKLKAQLEEKENELKAFAESQPTDGNGKGKMSGTTGDLTIDGVAALISKLGR